MFEKALRKISGEPFVSKDECKSLYDLCPSLLLPFRHLLVVGSSKDLVFNCMVKKFLAWD